MRLPELIDGLPIAALDLGEGVEEIFGVGHDSRSVCPGDLFVGWAGAEHDGAAYGSQAVRRGAVAVLTATPLAESLDVPALTTRDPHALLATLAARVYGHPDRDLRLVGVTGTNGKTTVVTLVTAILEAERRSTACFGTLGYVFGDDRIEAARTTPEASDLFRLLRRFHDAGAVDAVMEVSSHALAQDRVAATRFDLALFLNLTRDHLDFHGDLETYFEDKARLFGLLKEDGVAVVNVDDPYGRRLAESLNAPLTFGSDASVHYLEVEIGLGGIAGRVRTPRFDVEIASPLLGDYNAENLLAAVAASEALGVSRHAIESAIAAQLPVDGRMEPVEAGQPFPVIVDYAHTHEALAAALRAMRSLTEGPVVVVFGCGGERDQGKRQLMGATVAELADVAVLTSDNPRREDPLAILAQVEKGLLATPGFDYEVIEDRRAAIRRAVDLATTGGAVLIAGKGHETTQTVGDERRPFVDREEARRAIEERFGTAKHQ